MVEELIRRKVYVYLCTNAVLLSRRIDRFTPSHFFSWVVHVDGLRERHDAAVDREGVFDEAVAAIRLAKEKGFRVTTNSTFFNTDSPKTVRDVLDFLNDDLGVDAMMISPGLRLREGARSGALPRGGADPEAVRRCLRAEAPEEVAAEPLAPLPGLPRGQVRLPVHGVGDPELLGARLAAAVLPDGGRVRQLLQGADRTTDWDAYGEGKDPAPIAAPTAWPTAATSPVRWAAIATMGSLRQSLSRPRRSPKHGHPSA
jgi:hypothetical protein